MNADERGYRKKWNLFICVDLRSSAAKSLHERRVLLRRVDPVRGPVHENHADPPPVLQRPQLLQLFRLLQRGGLPRREVAQKLPPVSIDAQMQIVRPPRSAVCPCAVPVKRNRRPAE